MGTVMANADRPTRKPQVSGDADRAAVQVQLRLAGGPVEYLNILPAHRADPAAQGFNYRLFGGELARQVSIRPLRFFEFARRENPLQKPLPDGWQDSLQPVDFHQVNTRPDLQPLHLSSGSQRAGADDHQVFGVHITPAGFDDLTGGDRRHLIWILAVIIQPQLEAFDVQDGISHPVV